MSKCNICEHLRSVGQANLCNKHLDELLEANSKLQEEQE